MANFHPRTIGLRGDKAQSKAVTNACRIHAMKGVPEGYEPEDYLVSHSSITYLMGPDGNLVTLFPHATTLKRMTTVLHKYLSGEAS